MAVPTQTTTIVKDDQALLTSGFRNQTIVPALLKCYLNRAQDLENTIWSVLNVFVLGATPGNGNAYGIWLDWLGKIVGQPRNSLSDTDYLTTIKLRIRANRSHGRAEDIIQIAALLANPNKALYVEAPPAAFTVEAWNINGAIPAANLLAQARALGTYGVLHYSVTPASSVLRFKSRYISTAGNGVLGSRYGGVSSPGNYAAAVPLN